MKQREISIKMTELQAKRLETIIDEVLEECQFLTKDDYKRLFRIKKKIKIAIFTPENDDIG